MYWARWVKVGRGKCVTGECGMIVPCARCVGMSVRVAGTRRRNYVVKDESDVCAKRPPHGKPGRLDLGNEFMG